MAIRVDYREAGDRHWLASAGIPAVLEVEEPPSLRPPVGVERSRGSHPEDESGQPALGCSAHPWRTVKTRNSDLASDRREVHGPAPKAAVAELADLSGEPHAELGLGRFLRGADDHVPAPICLCDSLP